MPTTSAPFTRPFSLVGVPAVSLPCGLGVRGRPLGLQLVGRHGADAWLLAVAEAVEEVLPGSQHYKTTKKPPSQKRCAPPSPTAMQKKEMRGAEQSALLTRLLNQ